MNSNLMAPLQNAQPGLCIGCALLHHDFTEILGCDAEDVYHDEVALPEAWIDGRRYRLCPRPSTVNETGSCRECKTFSPSLYLPEV